MRRPRAPPSPLLSGKFLIFQSLAGWQRPQNLDCKGVKYQNLHCKGLTAAFRSFGGSARRFPGLAVCALRFAGYFDCARMGGNNLQIVVFLLLSCGDCAGADSGRVRVSPPNNKSKGNRGSFDSSPQRRRPFAAVGERGDRLRAAGADDSGAGYSVTGSERMKAGLTTPSL